MVAKFTTPIGKAYYTYAFKPDTQFKEDGEFGVKLRLGGEEAIDIQKRVDEWLNASHEKAKSENPAKSIRKFDAPYKEVMNEDGTPTGELEFKIVQRAVTKTKNGPWHRKIAVFDAEGTPITNEVRIGNGSKVRVAVQPEYWYTPALGAGLRLAFRGLQIVELIEYNPESSDVSFDAVDGGYKHENNNDNSEGANDGSEEFFSSEENEEDF